MRLSIGIPVHNEEEVLPELIPRLLAVLDRIPGGPHEALFVDDGSTDGTRHFLKGIVRRDPRVRVVALSRNFGHQAALGAAIDHATGDALVLMDGDLQDEPEIIPELVRRHEAGADVVYTRRESREEGLFLRLAYRLYYRIVSSLSEVALPLDSGDFALLGPPRGRRPAGLARASAISQGVARPGLASRRSGLDVSRRIRAAGRPKYRSGSSSNWHWMASVRFRSYRFGPRRSPDWPPSRRLSCSPCMPSTSGWPARPCRRDSPPRSWS